MNSVAWAAGPTTGPVVGGMGHSAVPADAARQKILPEIHFNDTSLDDALAFIQSVSGVTVVLVREPGVVSTYPQIGQFVAKNITVEQFLRFVAGAYEGVSLKTIEGAGDPIYVLRISVTNVSDYYTAAPRQVRVFSLAGIDRALEQEKVSTTAPTQAAADSNRARAMDAVLSLIQTALSEVENAPTAELKVHQPTETLVFKGTAKQAAIVEQVLASRNPRSWNQPMPVIPMQMPMMDQNIRAAQDAANQLYLRGGAPGSFEPIVPPPPGPPRR